ncbi:sensor histidine kinase [Methylobacillus sp.]|uniref:sensor histidine kinase n=1 Tax=Methylobacillus sp. TaxID=56818 RepID=UPI002FDF70B3
MGNLHPAPSKWVEARLCPSEAELDRIFQPFYRADHTGHVSGHGLGLAIAKQVLDLHGGKIKLQNRQSGGLTVEVWLLVVPLSS